MKVKSKYQNVTASINKRNGKWICMIRDTTGEKPRQISRATKQTNWHKAETVALAILDELYADPDTIPVQSSQTGQTILTVTDMVQSYFNGTYMAKQLADHPPEKIKKHVSSMNGRIKHLSEFFTNTPVRRLNKSHINNYIEHRRKKAVDGTILVELNALFAAINSELSNSDRYNVISNCRDHWPLKKTRRKETLSYEQFDAIHEKLQEYDRKHHSHFALFVELLLFTGIRWGTMSALKFNMIGFENYILRFEKEDLKSTTMLYHDVSIDKELATSLYRLKEKNDNSDKPREYVFASTAHPDKPFSRTTFYNAWYEAQESLGYKKRDEKKGKDVYLFRPHDLKRTYIIESLEIGDDRAEIKQATGNVSDTIFDGYVSNRRAARNAQDRRAKRQAMIDQEKAREQKVRDLAADIESGIWDLGTLDELEIAVKKKKAALENLNITDKDVDI